MNCTFLDDNIIRIGDNALIAPNVQIYTAFHPTNAIDRFGIPKEDGSFEFVKHKQHQLSLVIMYGLVAELLFYRALPSGIML